MKIAVCPGSFDPVTNGHMDIFKRTIRIFDKLIIAVFNNPVKNTWFSVKERVEMLKEVTLNFNNKNIEIMHFDGLLLDFCNNVNACAIVRGLRVLSDFEYEFQRALLLKKFDDKIDTIFLMTANEYSFISSTNIKELAYFGGELKEFVPLHVKNKIEHKCRWRYRT